MEHTSNTLYLIFFFNLVIFQLSNLEIQAQTMRTAFINGKIYTVNEKQPYAEAVIVEGNKINFVGTTKDARKLIDASTNVIDLEGKLMIPGLTTVTFTSQAVDIIFLE
jgi:hypothetical protein